jgi:hypothetical protein
MAESAFMTQYRTEFIAGFEQGVSHLMGTATTERVIQGNTATFLIADTGDAEAVTRGVNGLIPARPDNLTQVSATLTEWHDLPRRTRFNIFASQGDGRRVLQDGTRKVLNRKVDDLLLTQLATATNDTGAAATLSLELVIKALTLLGLEDVPTEEMENIFGVISPAAMGYLLQIPEYTSAEYVDVKPFANSTLRMRNWAGINWIVSNRLPGRTTNAEKLFVFHRSALGWAVDTEQDYYWARASAFMGAKLLNNAGVVVINHDGSAFTAS